MNYFKDIEDVDNWMVPLSSATSYRFSVGYHRGRHRRVIAWFQDFDPARDYLIRFRAAHPSLTCDLLQSLM